MLESIKQTGKIVNRVDEAYVRDDPEGFLRVIREITDGTKKLIMTNTINIMQNGPSPNYIDIFAGCGGLSLGLYNAGWKGLFAIEKNPMAFATLKHNLIDRKAHFDWPRWLPVSAHDINEVLDNFQSQLISLEGQVDLVAGGPPCQGFSFAGRRKEHDERNQLVKSYIKFVSLVKPSMIFFENVPGFNSPFIRHSTYGQTYSKIVVESLKSLGYDIEAEIIDFSKYGIPQRRKRFILVGSTDGKAQNFFEKLKKSKYSFLRRKGLLYTTTASEAISDIERSKGEEPSLDSKNFMAGVYGEIESSYQKLMRKSCNNYRPDSHRFANHSDEIINRFNFFLHNYERNKNIARYQKLGINSKKSSLILLSQDSPAPSLTTLPDDYIHYSEPRILTVREYARLQSFNDWFEFREKYTTGGKKRSIEVPRYSQVGNAIPPLFVELSGRMMKSLLKT